MTKFFSREGGSVNSSITENIGYKFGKLLHTTGKKHTFLGMDIEFIEDKKVVLDITHNNNEALEDFWENLKGNVVNPETSQPFTITSEAKDIDDENKESYHLITS